MPLRDLFRTALNIKVGVKSEVKDNQEEYVVHAELLCYYSPFFKAATSGNWAEAKTGVVHLPDDDPRVFEVFQDWIYGARLGLMSGQDVDTSLLLALWVFGDKVQVPGFQNAAIEALRDRTCNPPRQFKLKDIKFAFENTAEESPLRKIIIDLYVWESSIDGSISNWLDEAYPKSFIAGVVEGYCVQFQRPGPIKLKKERPYAENAKRYHVTGEVLAPGP